MSDLITLKGLRVRGFHGVLAHERATGQDFVIDVSLHLDTSAAGACDDLAATVNYAELAQAVHDIVAGEPVNLIETLAERIAATALASGAGVDPFVTAAEVTVHKPGAPIPLDFEDVSVSVRRSSESQVVLALGSNLGDRAALLDAAVASLRRVCGLALTAVSPWYETAPVGGPEQGPYLNGVVLGTTSLSPRQLLEKTARIEAVAGRVREVRWGPRTLDIDLITFGNITSDRPELSLPHPRAQERGFVLVPWAAVDREAHLPGYGSVAQLAAGFPEVRVWPGEAAS